MNHWHTLEKLDSLIPANINLSKVETLEKDVKHVQS